MTPQELSKLRPEADTAAAIRAALDRIAAARTVAEGEHAAAEAAQALLIADGGDAKARRAAEDRLADSRFTQSQLDRIEAELREQLVAAEEREAAQAKAGEIEQLQAAAEAHAKAWSRDLPKHVAAIEALLAERGYLVGRASELGRSEVTAGWSADLRPPLERSLDPTAGWLLPSTDGMRAEAAAARVAQAKTIRQAELEAEGNHRLSLRGFANWPVNGPKTATFSLGEQGRTYSVYGRSVAGGVPVEMDWPEAVRICDVALVPATLRHPTEGALQFPGRGNQANEPAAA